MVDVTSMETGNSEAAAELANAFKSFEGIGIDALGKMRATQGQQEGTEAGANGTPEFRAGLRAQTAYGQAYNNAAMRSYAIKAEADAEDNAARLEVEAQNDPEKFATLFGAFRDESIKQAPKEARGTLSSIYTQRLGAGVTRLTRARAIEQNNLARADTLEGVERTVDKVATLSAEDDPVSYERSLEAQAQLTLMIDGAVNDGTITMTEGQALHKSADRQVFSQTVAARFRRVLDSPTGSPVEFIEKLRVENKKSDALSPKEEDELIDSLVAELSQHNQLLHAGLAESTATMKARYEQGNRDATAELFSGTLTVGTLRTMVQQQKLDPDTARSLMNELQSGGNKIVDDQKELFSTRTNLINISDEDITNNTKLSYDTRADLLLQKREMEKTWKATQAAREANDRIERSLGILPGTDPKTLTDAQRVRLDQAQTAWYNEVDKLPAGERQAVVITIAEDVVTRFIRKEKASIAQEARTNKQRFIDAQLAKYGPPEKYDEQARKKYQESLQRFDATSLQNESEAARK